MREGEKIAFIAFVFCLPLPPSLFLSLSLSILQGEGEDGGEIRAPDH